MHECRSTLYLWVVYAALSCDEPENLTNGDRIGHDFTFMKTIHYICHAGYRLNGSRTRTCTASKTWTGSGPSCVQHFFYGNCIYHTCGFKKHCDSVCACMHVCVLVCVCVGVCKYVCVQMISQMRINLGPCHMV